MSGTKGKKLNRVSPAIQKLIVDDVRAGLLQLPQIAAKHSVEYHSVYRIAKKVEAVGELRGEIISTAQNKIIATHMGNNPNDGVVVEKNAMMVLELVRGHAEQVGKARNIASSLMQDLEHTILNREQIEDDIAAATAEDQSPTRRNNMLRAVSLPVNTKTLADLAGALKTLITLEREMFKLDKDTGDDDKNQSLEDYVLSLDGEAERVTS